MTLYFTLTSQVSHFSLLDSIWELPSSSREKRPTGGLILRVERDCLHIPNNGEASTDGTIHLPSSLLISRSRRLSRSVSDAWFLRSKCVFDRVKWVKYCRKVKTIIFVDTERVYVSIFLISSPLSINLSLYFLFFQN